MEIWTKVVLFLGLLMIVGPAMLRIDDFIDNSTFTALFVIGIILVLIGNNNRIRQSESPVSARQ